MATSVQINASISPAAPAVAVPKARMVYIDTIRVILTVLVVMVHAAVTYGSVGGWFIQYKVDDDLTQGLLSLFVILCQAFFMGLFFFISGYFIPGSVDRKGLGAFWKDRLLRLALPFLAFSFVLSKYPRFIYETSIHPTASFGDFFSAHFFDAADAGPTWFLFALLVLSAGYSLWRLTRAQFAPALAPERRPQLPALNRTHLLGFALLMAALMFAVAQFSPIGVFFPAFGFIYLQPAFFPQYLMMFAAGVLAYRAQWLDRLESSQLRFWAWTALSCVVALPVIFVAGGAVSGLFDAYMTGVHWQSVAITLWMALTCVSCSLTLILWLRGRQGQPGRLALEINASAFAAFLIHPVVLVAITTALADVSLHPLLKFAVASAAAVTCSFLAGWLLRLIPGARQIL